MVDSHGGAPGFAGERWSTHDTDCNDKLATAQKYGLHLVLGRDGAEFSADPSVLTYGSPAHSGFQAVGLALLKGCTRIALVGFDLRVVSGRSHFFGDHPQPLRTNSDADFRRFTQSFERAAKLLPAGVEIINCTAGSALRCFPMVDLETALAPRRAA